MQRVRSIHETLSGNQEVRLWNWQSFCPIEDVELMQFTGLLDTKGKECFEGDLGKDCFGKLWEFRWDETQAGFRVRLIGDENLPIETMTRPIDGSISYKKPNMVKLEVIGNIWEHKHLLEGK